MRTSVLLLNLVVSLASAAWAGVALLRPASLSGSSHVTSGEKFYLRMYAARAIPFGLAVGLLPFWSASKAALPCILITAAIVQLLDILIAMQSKKPPMMVGASVGAIVHLLCGLMILTGSSQPWSSHGFTN